MTTNSALSDSKFARPVSPRGHKLVMIATDNPDHAAFIGVQLEQSGFDTHIALYDGKTLKGAPRTPPRAILVSLSNHLDAVPDIITTLKKRYQAAAPMMIGAVPQADKAYAGLCDSLIFPPAHPAQIAARVTSMIRLSAMQREITLRIETLREDFGIDYQFAVSATEERFRVLFIGKASPEFMVIINALDRRNVDVIAAFTSYSAFDFMHENHFDAVVMNMLGSPEPAMSISAAMRRNARLYHTPSLFLTGKDFGAHDHAFAKGATDIIPFGASEEEMSGRILELANYHRLHTQLKTEFGNLGGERCTESASGTYNQKFFYAHLRRVMAADKYAGLPSAMMLVRIDKRGGDVVADDILQAAYDQVGSMIKNMVRMEDVVARLGNNLYAVAFPSQFASTIQVVADRLSGAIASMVFPKGDSAYGTYQLALDCRISDCQNDSNEARTPAPKNTAAKPPQTLTQAR